VRERRSRHTARKQRPDDDRHETEIGDEQREVEHTARDRPRQRHFECAALPLAGDGGCRVADRKHGRQDDRDWMNQAERD
jgi:hypothetical protein